MLLDYAAQITKDHALYVEHNANLSVTMEIVCQHNLSLSSTLRLFLTASASFSYILIGTKAFWFRYNFLFFARIGAGVELVI